ncbi:C40 family peptidase [Streptomyces sp. NPDC092307]|uniref:C40 family peptidase n=1 Tax=Streptomyces sp. NPDC092307 TaxID=3366013 RepID=UPI0038052D8A
MQTRTEVKKHRYVLITTLALAMNCGMTFGSSRAEAASVPSYAIRAFDIAMSQRGAPYVYGATGPRQFDCSGLVLFSYKKAGKTLPRTAQQQFNVAHRVSKDARRRGDLVFFRNGGGVYHVGIYAGANLILHAPKTGSRVKVERIWSGTAVYGRVN